MARKRVVIVVSWSKRHRLWLVRSLGAAVSYSTREAAIYFGARTGRGIWSNGNGRPAQLVVHNRGNGRISFERTYGLDPRRYKG